MEIIKWSGKDNIFFTAEMKDEYQSLFKKNKSLKREFESWLDKKLGILDVQLANALDGKTFCTISGQSDLSYIKTLQMKYGNSRIIYAIIEDEFALLLTVFQEKNKKDYKFAIRKAVSRLNLFKEDFA